MLVLQKYLRKDSLQNNTDELTQVPKSFYY